MSRHPHHGTGAYDANSANGAQGAYGANGLYPDDGDTQNLPAVYHPYGDTTRAYDGYVDPAAAHGWHEPPAGGPGAPGQYEDAHGAYPGEHGDPYGLRESGGDAYDPYGDDGGAADDESVFVDGSGRRSRVISRAALAVAVVFVVFIGVVIAGFFGSGPSGGSAPWSQENEQEHEGDDAEPISDPPGSTAAESTTGPTAGAGESAKPSPSATASQNPDNTTEPTTKAPSTTGASTTSEPAKGNGGDNPGHGQGATKGPK